LSAQRVAVLAAADSYAARHGSASHLVVVSFVNSVRKFPKRSCFILDQQLRSRVERLLSAIARERAVAVVLTPGPFFFTHQNQIAEITIKRRLPVLGWVRPLAESGALMSYGADNAEIIRRAASHVARILNGTPPAELPVEQPTKIDLVINLKTAKALGLTIPQSVLGRADHLIE
jgi:putative tryptophan/tyrosine transport system substrate-binding protein